MTSQRLGYQASIAGLPAPNRPHDVELLFNDRLESIHCQRPALHALLAYTRAADTVVVGSMDQIARSLTDLHRVINAFINCGARIEFSKEELSFDPLTRVSASNLKTLTALATFERTHASDRQRAGINTAKGRGVYKGRTRKLNPEQAQELKRRSAEGESKTQLAIEYGISRETVYQYIRLPDTANQNDQNTAI